MFNEIHRNRIRIPPTDGDGKLAEQAIGFGRESSGPGGSDLVPIVDTEIEKH